MCYELTPDVLHECGHTLCHECAEAWFSTHSACPVCRTEIAWGKTCEKRETLEVAEWQLEWLREQADRRVTHLSRFLRLFLATELPARDVRFYVPSSHVSRRTHGLVLSDVRDGVYVLQTAVDTPPYLDWLQAGDVITHANACRVRAADMVFRLILNTLHPSNIRLRLAPG